MRKRSRCARLVGNDAWPSYGGRRHDYLRGDWGQLSEEKSLGAWRTAAAAAGRGLVGRLAGHIIRHDRVCKGEQQLCEVRVAASTARLGEWSLQKARMCSASSS